ncbi:MAG TPA: hypothetical protein GX501_06020 [Clostridiaceae bacterium]|nr:hypothetical protein [Clostridiaceae bacterium]
MKRKYTILLAILSLTVLFGCSRKEPMDSRQGVPDSAPAPVVTADKNTEERNQETKGNANKAEPVVVTINVTSESLTSDGKWLTVINSTKGRPAGSNLSPQLSWDEVEGASCYAVYMFDNSARYWLHWLAKNVTETTLPLGAELEDSKYEGPYPPSGTHEYEVIVYALKEAPAEYPGSFDNSNASVEAIEEKLDTANGLSGNIIGKGSITGTVTVGEPVE